MFWNPQSSDTVPENAVSVFVQFRKLDWTALPSKEANLNQTSTEKLSMLQTEIGAYVLPEEFTHSLSEVLIQQLVVAAHLCQLESPDVKEPRVPPIQASRQKYFELDINPLNINIIPLLMHQSGIP